MTPKKLSEPNKQQQVNLQQRLTHEKNRSNKLWRQNNLKQQNNKKYHVSLGMSKNEAWEAKIKCWKIFHAVRRKILLKLIKSDHSWLLLSCSIKFTIKHTSFIFMKLMMCRWTEIIFASHTHLAVILKDFNAWTMKETSLEILMSSGRVLERVY